MSNFWMQLPVLGKVFAVCALVATIFFFIRVVLMLMGADADADVDVDMDVELDSGAAFEVLSINSIVAFLMMFGWMGLACHIQFAMPASKSIIFAILAGSASMIVTALLFKSAKSLASAGAKFTVIELVGSVGTVYQKIPEAGKGRIQIKTKNGMMREVDAIAKDKQEIASFVNIKVVSTIDDNTVEVETI